MTHMVEVANLSHSANGRLLLSNISISLPGKQSTALVGPNGSGKSLLAGFIANRWSLGTQRATYPKGLSPEKDIAFVSFEFQRELYDFDNRNDDTEFLGFQDKGTTARQAILIHHSQDEHFDKTVSLLNIHYLLDRGIRFLSTGEIRKVLIARALLNEPKLLIIDSPFEGLDHKSRSFMRQRLQRLMTSQACLLLMNEDDELLDSCNTVHLLDKGSLIQSLAPHEIRQCSEWRILFTPHQKIVSIPCGGRTPDNEQYRYSYSHEKYQR
ncbi:MAG: ATP-binding cassette domain-containing protein [Lentisphaeraceae bacterium]|nr:ATP-binding cassette domain-containing protein [Lentisphaeraceae bacterium]